LISGCFACKINLKLTGSARRESGGISPRFYFARTGIAQLWADNQQHAKRDAPDRHFKRIDPPICAIDGPNVLKLSICGWLNFTRNLVLAVATVRYVEGFFLKD
jgi:hypothetical protein